MAKRKSKAETIEGVIGPAEPPTETYSEAASEEQMKDSNIIFIGKRVRNGKTEAAEPPPFVIDGRDKFDLPDAQTQAAGFYHADATRIIRAFPQMYKPFIKLGDR